MVRPSYLTLAAGCPILFDLYLAWMSFYLGSRWQTMPREAAAFAWSLVALQIAGVVLSIRYFSVAPASLSLLLVACFLLAALSIPRALRQQAT